MMANHWLYSLYPPYLVRHQLRVLRQQQRYRQARRSQSENLFKIFDRYRCLFVHIPKAGGVSFYNSLFAAAAKEPYIKSIGHYSIKDYELIFGSKALQSYFKFTVVRNPWARVFSAYTFLRSGGFHQKDAAWAEKHLSKFSSFEDFVNQWLCAQNAARAIHFVPQHEFLRSRSGQINIDHVGRLETIQADFDVIKNRLGVGEEIQHLNRGSRSRESRSYRQMYTARSKRVVASVYKKDIEVFGYEF